MRDHIAIFSHHMYEYKKGLRRLVLYTGTVAHVDQMTRRLEQNDIAFHFAEVTSAKVNCFFGDPDCIEVIRSFGNKPLHELSDHEDLILGALLGYDLKQQCQRLLSRQTIELKKVA